MTETDVGQIAALLALGSALYSVLAAATGARLRRPELVQSAARGVLATGGLIALMMGYQVFFLGLISFVVDSPWTRLANPPRDGQGLMPLLQHPTMLVHPPALYTGYVAFSVPFAFAMAALITGRVGDEWIRTTRRWTLVAWLFLGGGLLLGGNWAYNELGWGGSPDVLLLDEPDAGGIKVRYGF